ncbi:hypothetical protein C7T35_15490 [Variovorax sp. WS11]|uniref:beta strand repeat-containing protein n=1 Tax=Variovorax sp. WS11 TaxID=1105204 RepID=UPI000D0CC54F|nr:hypothetical protein [Variovorax sp. WS11]NDZ12034.1 hypothetical protein [Variovorax sp. WS11]PSL83781.1 hypothetical protein C7T35_15490 [Variovorax sp. WS11]
MTILQNLTANTNVFQQLNENFDAVSPAGMYGKRAPATSGLTWGYYGGRGFGNSIADGTVALTSSTTNYVVANRSTGAVSVSTSLTNWNDATNYWRLYLIATGASTITSATDYREFVGVTSITTDNDTTLAADSSVNVPTQHAVKSYVDNLVQGLSWKKAVRAATTANGTLASSFENGDAIDGVTLATGDRILLKDQATTYENGIYTVNASGAPTRATDANTGAELVNATVYVSEGSTLADTQWTCTTNAPITVGSTSLAFAQLSAGGGSGTVTSVDASGGVETASGSPITATGTIRASTLVNAQTGTTYTYVTGDRGKLVTHSNASAIAGTLPQATSTFGSGWFMRVKNKGAGTLTITPTTSTIDGVATLVLTTGQWAVIVSDGTNYQAYVYAPAGGGSLTNWTEAVSTAAPNNVVPAVSFTATNAATNVDAVIAAKGTGSILANVPDSGTPGGNKRGTRAVDFQTERSAAAQVASGTNAVIGGGRNNTSLQNYGTVSGGDGNAANGAGSRSVIGGGGGNTASGSYSTIPGGLNCVASANYTLAYGSTCTASADYSEAGGFTSTADGVGSRAFGQFATARGVRGADAFAPGRRTATGDAQRRSVVLFRTTSDGTTTALTADGSTPSTANQLNLPSALSFKVRGQVIGMRSDGSVSAWDVSFIAKRVGTTTSIVGTPTVTNVGSDGGATGYTLAIAADDTNDVVQINVTGTAGHTVYWLAELTSLEVG